MLVRFDDNALRKLMMTERNFGEEGHKGVPWLQEGEGRGEIGAFERSGFFRSHVEFLYYFDCLFLIASLVPKIPCIKFKLMLNF